MSGVRLLPPRVLGGASRRSFRSLAVLALTAVSVAVLILGLWAGAVPTNSRLDRPAGSLHGVGLDATPADFSVVNLTANNTTVDVSMAFNVSVDVVNLTGGAINSTNTSNYSFVWAGLPAFVHGDAGSGCVGVNPYNYSFVAANDSSLLDCSAASAGKLSISVTVTNLTSSQSNSSSPALSILVNVLPTTTAFTVTTSGQSPSDHVKVLVNSTITFAVTASGGTGALTYAYTGLPLGCSSSAATFSCAPNRVGVYNVTVTVTDSYGYSTSPINVTVTVAAPTTTTSSGIGTTGWAIVIGILVIGGLATVALFVQAGREERRGRMGMEQAQESANETGESPPIGGSPPPGPPS